LAQVGADSWCCWMSSSAAPGILHTPSQFDHSTYLNGVVPNSHEDFMHRVSSATLRLLLGLAPLGPR
jgi:hypothetical protein